MGAAAFFDLDKTICARNTESVFGQQLFRSRELPPLVLADVLYTYLRYDLGILKDFDAVKRKLLRKVFAGKTVERVATVWRQCYERHLQHAVYEDVRRLVDEHRNGGLEIYVVSASLNFIVESFCDDLEIAEHRSTALEVCNGVFTGKVSGPIYYGKRKGQLVRETAAASGIDLLQSFAYGDNIADRHMLEAVGNPVAVNPDKKLAHLARQRKWRIVAAQ